MPTPNATPPAASSVCPSVARWRLTTRHAQADRVFYAHEEEDGLTTWTPMIRSGPASDEWTLKVFDAPRPGRFRVYTVEQASVINCGSADLTWHALPAAQPHTPPQPRPCPRAGSGAGPGLGSG